MANVNNAHGLRPLMRSIAGGPAAVLPAHKLVGDGTALFIYDAVAKAASGTKTTQCITAGTAGAALEGVNLIYGKAATATDHLIIPGTTQVFEAQIDTIAAANMGQNCALVAGAGSTVTYMSGHSLNGVAATNTLAFHVVGLWASSDNALGAYARIEVIFNKGQLVDQALGV